MVTFAQYYKSASDTLIEAAQIGDMVKVQESIEIGCQAIQHAVNDFQRMLELGLIRTAIDIHTLMLSRNTIPVKVTSEKEK